MLYEKTTYEENFPIHIRVVKVEEYPFHYHQDIEFVYVLEGEIVLKNGYYDYTLKEGDIFLNSGHEVHGLKATNGDNVVAIIQVSNWFFTRYFPSLPKACFRTYTRDEGNTKLDTLRQMLLSIMLNYYRRAFDYQSKCNLIMVNAIDYMNKWFNLFAFQDRTVVNFESDDPVTVGRISRIINYIYANHSGKITLDDLSEIEHLSAYYISHLIKEHMGISFQEFLCFARVEMSEIELLDTDNKISTVGRNAGFSTTAYYEKYFKKWFGLSPLEHRAKYRPHILGAHNPARLKSLPDSRILHVLQQCFSAISGQSLNPFTRSYQQLSIDVDPLCTPLVSLDHKLDVTVTPNDFCAMGQSIWSALKILRPALVTVAKDIESPGADPTMSSGEKVCDLSSLAQEVESRGFTCRTASSAVPQRTGVFGADSIAALPYIFDKHFASAAYVPCRLRDQDKSAGVLKGSLSCLTSSCIPKPAMYAYSLLSFLKGDLLYNNKYYSVIRHKSENSDVYILLTMNYGDDIRQLCGKKTGVFETGDIINNYIDQVDMNFTIPLKSGSYHVLKYTFGRENNIFAYMSQLGFPEAVRFPRGFRELLSTGPFVQMFAEEVTDSLNLTINAYGASMQVTIIQPADIDYPSIEFA